VSSAVYHFTLGTFECLAISDGAFAYPASTLFVNADPTKLQRALRARQLPAHQITTSYTCLLILAGRHRVLVDTGAGRLVPSTGRLLMGLHAAGVAPSDIDTVILSHGHPDQIGGATDGAGRPSFPRARYVMSRAEWAFWASESSLATLEELLVTSARTHLPSLRSQLDLVDHDEDILPGIRAIVAPGHTPGHMALAMTSGTERLLYSADAAVHPLHLAYPAWYPSSDLWPGQAVATRQALFNGAAASKDLVLGGHFPVPGLGYVRRKRTGWHWQPLQMLPNALPGAGPIPERTL
jgi:glyoxylase-like metal-dependent hydrolase (beta-lactamase superfamily II)